MKTDSQNENQAENDLNTPTVDVCPNDEFCSDGEIKNQQSKIRIAPARPRRAAHRRMRRTRSANQNPDSGTKNSKLKTHNSGASSRPHRASPFQPLPELAHLSAQDLEAIHNLIREVIIPDVAKFLFTKHQISISEHRLYRYRTRLYLADQLQVSQDNAPAIQNLLGLLAGKPVDIDAAGIHIIKQRAVGLAADPNSSPSLLKDLFRIFTYNDRLSLQQRRVKCTERMTKVAERRQKFVEKTHKSARKSNWQATADALVKVVGDLPPIIPYTGPLPPDDDEPTDNLNGSTPLQDFDGSPHL